MSGRVRKAAEEIHQGHMEGMDKLGTAEGGNLLTLAAILEALLLLCEELERVNDSLERTWHGGPK